MDILKADQISKVYPSSGFEVKVLEDISFSLAIGEILGIRGGNGTGKTTLFNILTGIEKPTHGHVSIIENFGRPIKMGVVSQNYIATLLPWLTIRENIVLPLKLQNLSLMEIENRLISIVSFLKLDKIPLKSYPHQLSGGQKQKVAIARALIDNPELLVLDEAFANLDHYSSLELLEALSNLHTSSQISMLIVSHNIDHSIFLCDRIITLNGRPAYIDNEFHIELPKPRQRSILISDEFAAYRTSILEFEYKALRGVYE